MKVNPRTVKIILDIVSAVAGVTACVIAENFLEKPELIPRRE